MPRAGPPPRGAFLRSAAFVAWRLFHGVCSAAFVRRRLFGERLYGKMVWMIYLISTAKVAGMNT